MNFKEVKISEVKPNPNNPRIIKDDKFLKLVKSITEFPEMLKIRPIVVNSDMVVLGGNMRLKACKEAGLKKVPIIIAADLSAEKQSEFIIKDNVGFGEWDYELLANGWDAEKLQDWGLDLPDFGTEIEAEEDDFEVPEGGIETDIVIGDLFEIGEHRLLCGDSIDSDQVARLMDGKKADMVFTDPPYGVAYTGKTKDKLEIENDNVSPDELKKLVTGWFSCVDFALREGGYLLATVPARQLHLIFASDWLERGWLRQIMVWNKSSMVMGRSEYHYKHEPILFGWKQGGVRLKSKDRTKTTVWDFDKPSANRQHPTMKPVEMWAYGIGNHTVVNNILYEPFLGSGTTMVAAHQLKRKCYGMELDPKYCQVIIDRMRKLDPSLVIKKNGEAIQ
jgi:DNA modification methylase